MIRLEKVKVVLNAATQLERVLVQDLTAQIREGEFVVVMGGNGAGKSTLLNLLAGEVIPQQGHIYIDDIDVTSLSVWNRAAWVSRVFQDPLQGCCPDLTVEENLALAYKRGEKRGFRWGIHRSLRKKFHEQVEELGIGLEEKLKEPMGCLSGGQRQAISLLMATLKPSKILLLDEHTSALDPKMAGLVLKLTLEQVRKKGLTALMVTHHISQAKLCGDRLWVMQQGTIVQDVQGTQKDKMLAGEVDHWLNL